MRDVVKAAEAIERSPWGWSVQFLDPMVFAAKARSKDSMSSPVSKYEAQVIVTVRRSSVQQSAKGDREIGKLVSEALSHSGDVMALEELQSVDPGQHVYRAEFYSSDAVVRLLINSTWLEIEVTSHTFP